MVRSALRDIIANQFLQNAVAYDTNIPDSLASMVETKGFEPSTFSLQSCCAPIAPRPHIEGSLRACPGPILANRRILAFGEFGNFHTQYLQ